MLLVVILNAVLAVLIVSAIAALHTRAILTDQWRPVARERRRRPRTPVYWPARRPARATRSAQRALPSAG